MSVLIKGMDMPKEGLYNLSFVQSDGVTICLIEELYPDGGGRLIEHKGVVEVPTPHGRLIDADRIQCVPYLTQEPTVIEAEEDGDEILVSDGKYVWMDIWNEDDGCYLESDTDLIGCAWMPKPEPWKGSNNEQ